MVAMSLAVHSEILGFDSSYGLSHVLCWSPELEMMFGRLDLPGANRDEHACTWVRCVAVAEVDLRGHFMTKINIQPSIMIVGLERS